MFVNDYNLIRMGKDQQKKFQREAEIARLHKELRGGSPRPSDRMLQSSRKLLRSLRLRISEGYRSERDLEIHPGSSLSQSRS